MSSTVESMPVTGELPVVDLSGRPAAVALQLREACETNGFFYLSNHRISDDLLAAVFAANREFHALPLEEKLEVRLNRHFRGYQPIGGSTLKLSTVEAAHHPNQSESFFARHIKNSSEGGGCPIDGPNQWPTRPAGFREALEAYMVRINQLGLRLAELMALALDEPPATFVDRYFGRPSLALRLLHYPAAERVQAGAFGIAPHTDYGFLTFLAQDEIGGLEIRSPAGQWQAVPPLPGTFVVNIGNALSLMTNGRFVSTAHRVINAASGASRYSIPVFFDPCLDARVEVLKAFDDHRQRPPPMDFGEYFYSRLSANFDFG